MDDYKTELGYADDVLSTLEEEVSLDQVISHTPETIKIDQPALIGSYVCTLIYTNNPAAFFITHPKKENELIPLLKSTLELTPEHEGAEVLVVFDGGDCNKPIVTGMVKQAIKVNDLNPTQVEIEKDKRESLVFEADKEIVLICGKSSITLTRAGKVLIRGAYILSRSSGVNTIKGGSVHLN